MIVGPFELEAPLARGGMGVVWRARHRVQGLPVAIKVLDADPGGDLGRALELEVRAVASLDHPNIVWVYDHGRVSPETAAAAKLQAGSPWLAMELAAGTLSRAPRPWAQVRRLLLDLLDALAHAHARGVLHRDLKPGNLLIADDGRLLLSDFGMGLSLGGGVSESLSGGTPPYMAPEQFGEPPWRQGPWTDLYAVGCLAWTLVTGQPPFRERSFEGWRRAHVATRPPTLEPARPIPDGFEEWLLTLLRKHPRERFERAADAAFALAELGGAGDGAALDLDHAAATVADSHRTTLVLPVRAPTPQGQATRLTERAPLPARWRRPNEARRDVRLLDAGLGLFGLRRLRLVGRQSERDRLWSALGQVTHRGRPEAILVRGPTGVGRSALARWIATRAHELGADWLVARWGPEASPMGGVRAAVRHALRLEDTHDEDAACLTELGHPALVPWLAGEAAPPSAVAALLASLAARRPLVWVLDDVQYGVEGLQVLSAVLELAAPVLAVATVADDTLAERPHEARLLDELAAPSIEVGPLSTSERRELLQALLPLAPDLAARLDDRARGHALFGVQLVADWVARGVLTAGPKGFDVREGAEAELPDSLAAVWGSRLDRLLADHPEWELPLAAMAALGLDVDLREWRAACTRLGTGARRSLWSALLQSRLASAAGPGRLRLAHPMLREAVLERSSRLTEIHAACAEAVAASGRGVSHRVGRHLAEAGQSEAALERLRVGLVNLRTVGDYSGAWALMQLWDRQVELAAGEGDPRRYEAHLYASETARMIGMPDVCQARARAAILWAQEHGDRVREGIARSGWSVQLLDRGDVAAVDEAERAVALLRSEESDDLMLALVRTAIVRQWAGNLPGALALAMEAVTMADAGASRWAAPAARMVLAQIQLACDRVREAETTLEEAIAGFEERGRPLSVADCVYLRAEVRLAQGRPDDAEAELWAAIAPLREAGSTIVAAPLASLGELLRSRGRHAEAREVLHDALRAAAAGRRELDTLHARTVLARLGLDLGERVDDQVEALLELARGRRGTHTLATELLALADALGEGSTADRLRHLVGPWLAPV